MTQKSRSTAVVGTSLWRERESGGPKSFCRSSRGMFASQAPYVDVLKMETRRQRKKKVVSLPQLKFLKDD